MKGWSPPSTNWFDLIRPYRPNIYIRQILEKTHERRIDTHHIFVDFKSAFDSTKISYLLCRDVWIWYPHKLIRPCKMTLLNTSSAVRIGKDPLPAVWYQTRFQTGWLAVVVTSLTWCWRAGGSRERGRLLALERSGEKNWASLVWKHEKETTWHTLLNSPKSHKWLSRQLSRRNDQSSARIIFSAWD